MKVRSMAAYLQGTHQMRNADYGAQKFVKAIKGEPFNGYADVPVCGQLHRLNATTSPHVYHWFSMWAADQFRTLLPQPFVIIPVPNKTALTADRAPFKCSVLADAVAARLNQLGIAAVSVPCLRWTQQLARAHDGGSRDPDFLAQNLSLVQVIPAGTIILVDDVLTSGGHLLACEKKLVEAGRAVSLAVTAGRTVYDQLASPYQLDEREIPEVRDYSHFFGTSA